MILAPEKKADTMNVQELRDALLRRTADPNGNRLVLIPRLKELQENESRARKQSLGVVGEKGRVVKLELINNNLQGEGLCSTRGQGLHKLKMFPRAGSIPSELGLLGNLTHLYLHENQLTGACPCSTTSTRTEVVLSHRLHSLGAGAADDTEVPLLEQQQPAGWV